MVVSLCVETSTTLNDFWYSGSESKKVSDNANNSKN